MTRDTAISIGLIAFLVLIIASLADAAMGAYPAAYLPEDCSFWSLSFACLARVSRSGALAVIGLSIVGAVLLPDGC